MDGVGGQRRGPGDEYDDNLDDRGHPENQQADLDGTDSGRAGFQRIVDRVRRIAGMRREDLVDCPAQPTRMVVSVSLTVRRATTCMHTQVVGLQHGHC